MFVYIQTLFLDALVNTQSEELLDRAEEDDAAHDSPSVHTEDTQRLSTERAETLIEAGLEPRPRQPRR